MLTSLLIQDTVGVADFPGDIARFESRPSKSASPRRLLAALNRKGQHKDLWEFRNGTSGNQGLHSYEPGMDIQRVQRENLK